MKIAVVAPSCPLKREAANAIEAIVAARGDCELLVHPQCFLVEGHFAGSDALRLEAFLACANDPACDAVWFAKGGYGSNRLLPGAIEELSEAARAKSYLGYSDCGFLLGALYQAGIGRQIHAPMPVDIRREGGADAVRRTLAWLAGDKSGLEPGLGEVPSAAFNLTTLAALASTRFIPSLAGHVLIVEEVAEHFYAIDRLFFQVASLLPNLAGLRLGDITDVPENDRPFGADSEGIARDWCSRAHVPYLGRALVGHSAANRIVPFGLARVGAGT